MDVKKRHVLVFPAGSEIGIEIFNSLKYSHHVNVFGASGKNDHASFIYPKENYFEDCLYVDHPGFIDRFNHFLVKYQIEYIYPTHDTVACFLAEHQSQLQAKVLTSCFETNRIARSKRLTYQTFQDFEFCPEIFSPNSERLPFPVFLKPDDGQGGKGTHIADNKEDLEFFLKKNQNLLVTEFLPGEELSVDCFTDASRNLLFIGPRTRERIQMGISFRSTALPVSEEIRRIAKTINENVLLNGAWFFQIKKARSGTFKLMEFAPRQSSTMGLYRHAGVNFALLTLFNAAGVPVQISPNLYNVQLDRCLHNRFKAELIFNRVYIDFDETIVIGEYVHDRVMAFIYQCRNNGIKVVLLTKHKNNLKDSLHACGISENLFENIIHIKEGESKWRFIDPDNAIFIDNYWFERREVNEKLGIPVFDVDAIECLLR